jgi:hypothetical protein
MAPDTNPWSAEHWDPVAQANYIRKYGMARARARANDAGSTVHGAPPIPKYDHKKHVKMVRVIVAHGNARRNAVPHVNISAHFDLGYSQPDFIGNLIDQEIDIILSPGDISFPVHFRLGFEARQVPFGNVVPIWPAPIDLGITESAPPVETPIPQLTYDLGIDESFLFSNTQGLTVNMGLGLSQRETFGDERDIFDVAMLLGFDANNDIQINTENIPVNMTLGLTEAATVSREQDIAASALLGLTESAAVEVAFDITAAFDIGLTVTAEEVGAVRYIAAHPLLGINEAAATDVVQTISANPSLGINETVFVGRERDIDASMDLGVSETSQLDAALQAISIDLGIDESAVADVLANIVSNHSLGINEAASISFENDLVESFGLGITATLPVYGLDTERTNTINDIHVGLDMFASPSMEYPLGPFNMNLGISEAATLLRETYQTANPALGVTVSPQVDALVRKLYGTFIAKHEGTTDLESFSLNIGQETDSRYIVAVISLQDTGFGISNVSNLNLGAVANATLIKRVSYGGVAQTEIWYAPFPTGNPVTCEYLLGANMASSCAIYTISSAASNTVFLMDSGSDAEASSTTSAITANMNTEKDTGFVVAGTINSSSSGFANGPPQLTQDATAGQRRFWSGVDTNNVDTFEIDVSTSQSKLIAAASFSAFERVDVGHTLGLGITESAILSKTQQNLFPSPAALGIDLTARLDSAFGASPSLGITQASNLIVLRNISASPALGISEAATIQLQKNLVAAPAIGASMAATVSALATAMVKTYRGFNNANNVAQASWSFAGNSIGTASADRWVFLLFGAHNGAAQALNSITIGGVTATIETLSGTLQQLNGLTGIAFANVPSGTTATVVFNFAANFVASTSNGVGYDWYTVVGALNTTATDTLNSNATTTPVSHTFSVADGGVAFATGVGNNVSHNITGNFGIDNNFTQYAAARALGSASIAQNTGAPVNETVNFNSMSTSGALCPIVGRSYTHT